MIGPTISPTEIGVPKNDTTSIFSSDPDGAPGFSVSLIAWCPRKSIQMSSVTPESISVGVNARMGDFNWVCAPLVVPVLRSYVSMTVARQLALIARAITRARQLTLKV